MSKLEKFIEENRNDFDDKIPSEKVWVKLETVLVKKENKHFLVTPLFRWSVAAAVVMLVGSIAIIVNKNFNHTGIAIKEKENKEAGAIVLTPEEAPQMNRFALMISMKQEELKLIAKDQPELYKKFAKDIIQLDSSYHILKTRLNVTSNREMLVEAMIQNLQLQLNVLNQQLNIIQQIKQSKKYSHEKNIPFT